MWKLEDIVGVGREPRREDRRDDQQTEQRRAEQRGLVTGEAFDQIHQVAPRGSIAACSMSTRRLMKTKSAPVQSVKPITAL
jgi:hypothetical protein